MKDKCVLSSFIALVVRNVFLLWQLLIARYDDSTENSREDGLSITRLETRSQPPGKIMISRLHDKTKPTLCIIRDYIVQSQPTVTFNFLLFQQPYLTSVICHVTEDLERLSVVLRVDPVLPIILRDA